MYPLPANETERLAALRDLAILDTPPEMQFDAVCRTACSLFRVPMATVTLVEADRQWFKAKCGFSAAGTPRTGSFCTYAILTDDVLVVEDTWADPRFADSPLVTGEPHVRFYAGAPIILAPGVRAGTVCVQDTKARVFSAAERAQLADLATVVAAQMSLHRTEARLRESEAHYRLLADNTSDMIVRSSLDTRRQYVSPASRTLLGYEPDELVGTLPMDQIHPDDAETFTRVLAALGAGRMARAVTRQRYRRKDGSWVWVEVTFNLTRHAVDGRPTGYVAAVRDVSEREESARRISHMARHDALTDLANRTLFRERLTQQLSAIRRGAGGFSVLCLDLDRFKAVNDGLGHQAGDALLCRIADRLKGLVRDEDTVARVGGDEFTIIQSGADRPEEGQHLARRLIEAIREPIDLEGERVVVGASIGIARAPQDGDSPDALYRHADLALYRAKAAGRNTFRFYEPGMCFDRTIRPRAAG
ncbi:MAG: sensor domain-containing diguanylate cyclase [Methylobacterium sp.]|uniref:sensor domain-containing diguanylate cyclase n=1 Tax=Methylobacterium sp. TaxID=409 RepID=UPI002723B47F|nr:sensor domain-containing diguanylate cyclase [Methylobacterium sp.]MDO9426783.1 sensor domain-containing diguanylate cyclase [Methylobacterium sp.]